MTTFGGQPRRRRRRDVIVGAVLLVVSALVSALSPEQQNQIEAGVRATALYPFLELHRASAERARVGERAAALQVERDSLVGTVMRLRTLAAQAVELRAREGLSLPELGSVHPAEVYPGRPRVGDPDVFVLRAPTLAALEYPTGVFTGRGLVGVARAQHGAGARGEFWSHPDFRVSVVTEDGSVSGIVQPLRGFGDQPVLLLDGAPFQSDIRTGTVLITTGISGVYPPGIVVGTVRELYEAEAGWMKRYIVEPAVRPEEAGIVLVWERPEVLPGDPITGIPAAQDSAATAAARGSATDSGGANDANDPDAVDIAIPADTAGAAPGGR